jgi:hypothetical protein
VRGEDGAGDLRALFALPAFEKDEDGEFNLGGRSFFRQFISVR